MIEQCINRNIVECKGLCRSLAGVVPVVLIETLWNVKSCSQSIKRGLGLCINRNIVECKAFQQNLDSSKSVRINRNIVECKVQNQFGFQYMKDFSINRNIVECKDVRIGSVTVVDLY